MHMSNIRLQLAHCMSHKLNGMHDNGHSYSIQLEVHSAHRQIGIGEKRNERKENQKIHLQNVLTVVLFDFARAHTHTQKHPEPLSMAPSDLNTVPHVVVPHKINDLHARTTCIVRRRTVNSDCCCKWFLMVCDCDGIVAEGSPLGLSSTIYGAAKWVVSNARSICIIQ